MTDIATNLGVVVIGRNEGERLKRCIRSIVPSVKTVYVDSGSIDGSVEWARSQGIFVLNLDLTVPFTAARARNAGLNELKKHLPGARYVQFVDGDCELNELWPVIAVSFLEAHPDIGAISGRLREYHPERSIYNWLCDREWDVPAGNVRACGGIAIFRIDAMESVGGFRNDLIAGEEPELCVRLRFAGWRIFRIDQEMAMHDAGMTRFGQWWQRVLRSGYAFAAGASLHGKTPERHWVWESRRAWLWGIWLPLACIVGTLLIGRWGWLVWLVFPLQVIRLTARNRGSVTERLTLAFFQMLSRFPEALGQLKFWRDRLFDRQVKLIEYK